MTKEEIENKILKDVNTMFHIHGLVINSYYMIRNEHTKNAYKRGIIELLSNVDETYYIEWSLEHNIIHVDIEEHGIKIINRNMVIEYYD